MAARLIQCPLCSNPVQPRFLTKGGICPTCDDERKKWQRAHFLHTSKVEQAKDMFYAQQHKKFLQVRKEQKAKIEAQAKEKALAAERKQLKEIYKEKASIALAKTSFLHYVERYSPGYETSWAHEHVANELEQFYRAVARKESPRLVLTLPSRIGKAIDNDYPVFTPKGWTTHGALKPGDYVFGSDGKPTRVVACSEEMDIDMEIEFSNGASIRAHSNHEWVVYHYRSGKPYIKETKEFVNDVKDGRKRCAYRKWRLPKLPIIDFPHQTLPLDPFIMGFHLADGTTGSSRITHHVNDTQPIQECTRRGCNIRHTSVDKHTKCVYSFLATNNGPSFVDILRSLGMDKHKFIPEMYKQSSVQQRLDLLSGLVSGDGCVAKNGTVSFYNTNKQLIDDVLFVLRSLGEDPSVIYSPANSYVRHKKDGTPFVSHEKESWCIMFKPSVDGFWVAVPRKSERLQPRKEPVIVSVAGVRYLDEPVRGKCIQVENKDGIYLVGEHMVPTHNSLLASDAGPAWALGNWPWMKFVLASYSDELPVDFSRNIRAQLQSPDFRQIFPNGAHLAKDDASVKAWSTTEGGGLRATGVGGGLLGFGCDYLVIDDPIKDQEQADNPAALEKVYDWFSSVAYSRLLPGGGIVIIMQRMSHDDLVGRLIKKMKEEESKVLELQQTATDILNDPESTAAEIEDAHNLLEEANELDESRDKWKILEYPALAVSDEYLNKETGEIVKVSPGVEVDSSLKPLRKVGEALHPKRYNRSYLLRLKRANPRRFAAMYMLAPAADDSAYFTQSDFKRYPEGKHPKLDHMTICCAWDQALGVKQQNDWTVGIAGGMDHKGDVYLLDIVKGKFADVRQVSDLVIDLHVKWKASITGIEKNHISMAMGPILKDRMRERGQYIALAEGKEALTPITDKLVRARTFQGLCRSGKVYVPEGEVWDSYISTMTAFTSTIHDDEVDASAWLGILLTRQPPPRNPSVVESAREAVVSAYDRLFKRREELEASDSFMSS